MGKRAWLWLGALVSLGCGPSPAGGGGEAKAPGPAPTASPQSAPALDLDSNYAGSVSEVAASFHRDAAEAKKASDALEPAWGAARPEILRASAARAGLYAKLHNKLARAPVQLFDESQQALLERAAEQANEALRQKGLFVETSVADAWVQACQQQLEEADRIVAEQAARVWNHARAEPSLQGELASARVLLGALRVQRGEAWLASTLGGPSELGALTAAPGTSPLLACESPRRLAPMGPVVGGETALPDGAVLPSAERAVTALGEGPRVVISARGLYWGKPRLRVAELGNDAAKVGFAAAYKAEPNSFELLPLSQAIRDQPTPKSAEVLLFADRATPYRALIEVVYTLNHAGYGRLLLVTNRPGSSRIEGLVTSGATSDWGDPTVFVVNDGYAIRLNDQRVGENCGTGPQSGMAVPLVAGKLNPTGLDDCLAKLLRSDTGYRATIVANPNTTYANLIATLEVVGARLTVHLLAPR